LIDAITAANTDIATGGCPAGSGADTIVLPAGSTQTLTAVNNNADGPNGLPSITSNLTIIGAGAGQTIIEAADSSARGFRLFHVAATGVLNLNGLTITGSSCVCDGGGIFNAGTLTLTNSTVSGNQIQDEGGGGIFNAGTLTLRDSTVSDNVAFGQAGTGGGIDNTGTLILLGSTVSGNSAERTGGGIVSSGPLTLSHSTVSDNSCGDCNGGGIFSSGPLTLSHSTVSGNRTTEGNGGGIAGPFGPGNAGAVTLTHTIIAGNIAFENSGLSDDCFNVMITSLGHNLVGVGCPSNGPGDLTVDPATVFTTVLGPLQNNGGRTQTHALLPGSPAIDAGGPMCTDATGAPLATDQRGKPRLVDGNGDSTAACDIGAVEFFPVVNDFVTLDPALETAFAPTAVPGGPAGTFTITATFTNTSTRPLRFSFFTVTALSGGNLLLNAEEGSMGVGATLTPEVGDAVFSPGETVAVDFLIGLQAQEPFRFFVDLFGEPLP
jgi:hypothetical protein